MIHFSFDVHFKKIIFLFVNVFNKNMTKKLIFIFIVKIILQTFTMQPIKRFKSLLVFLILFLNLLYLFLIILCITLKPDDRAQAIPPEIGYTINPTPVTGNVTDVAVAPIITTVSTDSNIDVSDLKQFYFFFDA